MSTGYRTLPADDLGPDAPRLLRPVVVLLGGRDATAGLWQLIALTYASTVATSAFYGFVGVWAVTALGASPGTVGLLLLTNAALSVVTGYLAGAASDRVGRRPILVACLLGQGVTVLACACVGDHLPLGFGLVVLASAIGTPAWAVRNAVVPDVVPPERRTAAFSTLRTITNLAMVTGPGLAGLLLALADWPLVFVVLGLLGVVSAGVARRCVPAAPASRADVPVARPQRRLAVVRDGPYVVMLLSTLMTLLVYVAYASVLPVVVVRSYGYDASTWGLLAVVNPVVVIAFQGFLTRKVGRRAPEARVALGSVLMGLPWLLLLPSHAIVAIIGVIVVVAFGEMLWAPASQTVSVDLAPAESRGAYQGAYGATMSIGLALGPAVGLALLQSHGTTVLWATQAAFAVVAAALGYLAIHRGAREASLRAARVGTEGPTEEGHSHGGA